MPKPSIRRYTNPAGGWGALEATGKALAEQKIALRGANTLVRMNQPTGFDCPGCAWPDPKHTSSFEFCENGAKAVAWEATAKRCTPAFFASHTVTELAGWGDYDHLGRARLIAGYRDLPVVGGGLRDELVQTIRCRGARYFKGDGFLGIDFANLRRQHAAACSQPDRSQPLIQES